MSVYRPSPNGEQVTPPPILWGYALAFGLLFTNLIFLAFALLPLDFDPLGDYSEERLASMARNSQAGARRVVMIGDSELMFGTLIDREFSGLISRRLGVPVSVVRIVSYGNTLSRVEPLFDSVLVNNPDLVVMQWSLLSKELTMATRYQIGRYYGLRRLFWQIERASLSEKAVQEIDMSACGRFEAAQSPEERLELMRRRIFFDVDGRSARIAAQFIGTVQRVGAEVALVRFPKLPTALADGPPRPPDDWHPAEGVADLAPPMVFGADEFCDFNHLNDRGRAVYSNWLAGALADLLRMNS